MALEALVRASESAARPFVAARSGLGLIGAVQAAGGGYDVAFENAVRRPLYGLDHRQQRQLHRSLIGAVMGNSSALKSIELVFDQDLNGDGIIDTPSTVVEASGSVTLTLTPFAQAATIDAGATLELAGADSSSVTFNGSTGTLALDHRQHSQGRFLGSLAQAIWPARMFSI